jgi:hypothetical protein
MTKLAVGLDLVSPYTPDCAAVKSQALWDLILAAELLAADLRLFNYGKQRNCGARV